MRFHQTILLFALALLPTALCDLEIDDVPVACQQSCMSTMQITSACEDQSPGRGFRVQRVSCVCGTANFQNQVSGCATCVKQNGFVGMRRNKVARIMADCGWSFAAVAPVTQIGVPPAVGVPAPVAPGTAPPPAVQPVNPPPQPPRMARKF